MGQILFVIHKMGSTEFVHMGGECGEAGSLEAAAPHRVQYKNSIGGGEENGTFSTWHISSKKEHQPLDVFWEWRI